MSNWNSHDRDLWRAAKYSQIYGPKAGQDYLFWTSGIPGAIIIIALCYEYPAIFLVPLGILLIWGGVAVFSRIKTSRRMESQRQAHQASVERRQAAINRLLYDLEQALKIGNDAAVGEVCKALAREEAFGDALPHLKVALGDMDSCLRLCAIRGLRWGTHFVDVRKNGNSTVVTRDQPSLLLTNFLTDPKETTQLRVAAAIALGNGGFTDAFGAIVNGLADPNPDVRAACCHAQGRIINVLHGDPSSATTPSVTAEMREAGFHTLLNAIHDGSARVRQEAAQALGEFRDPRALRWLQELAADPTQPEAVRWAAGDAAAAIKQGVAHGAF